METLKKLQKRTHLMSTGERLTTREMCDKFKIPMHWCSGRDTADCLRYHSRRSRSIFALDGEGRTSSQWGAALGVTQGAFRETVYRSETLGATRDQAMIATVRFLHKRRGGQKTDIKTETQKLTLKTE